MKVCVRDEASTGLSPVFRKIARHCLAELGLDDKEISVLLTDNAGIRDLNRRFRRIDKATDVLSFPMGDDVLIGDVAISVEKALEQAGEFRVTPDDELSRLFIHGLLHLLGYDHVKGGTQAKRMKAMEEKLLRGWKDAVKPKR